VWYLSFHTKERENIDRRTMRVLGVLSFASIAISAYGFVSGGASRRPPLALAANPLETIFSNERG